MDNFEFVFVFAGIVWRFKPLTNLFRLYHGNLTSSNILLSSDNILFITDFAPYKPLCFDQNHFDKIKLFYPNVLEKCYRAPESIDADMAEKYNTIEIANLGPEDLKEVQRMDIFALGCILSEIYTDTKPILGYK